MAVSIVGILALLIVGFFGLLLITLLVVLSAKAMGGRKGVGGGLAVFAVICGLLMLFAALGSVQKPVFDSSHDGGHSLTSPNHNNEHPLSSQVRVNPGQFVVELENVEMVSDSSTPVEDSGLRSSLTVAGNPWTDAVEEFQDFEADVYPSLESAAEALGRRVGLRLIMPERTNAEPRSIYVWREGDDGTFQGHAITDSDLVISRKILDAVASGIRQKLDDPAYVSVEQAPSGNRADHSLVTVVLQDFVFDHHNRWRSHAESRTGAVALRVETADEPFSVSTRFSDVPWVEDRTGFARRYANGDWLVGYSDGTHTSNDEARRDAIMAASDALLPLAQARINRLSASDQHRFSQQMQKDPNWLRDKVADELVSRNLATDQFAQRFDRSYGTVWREAVLVDASPQRVEQIARSLVQGLGSKATHERNTWFSFAALLALVFGTYLFLNIATKGYYTWTLRLAAVAGASVVVLVILNFA